MPKMAPMPKASRHPMLAGKFDVFRTNQRAGRSRSRTQPVCPVDHQVHATAHTRGDQLVNRRVDGGVFAADPGAGEKACDEEIPRRESECGGNGGDQIHREGQHEEIAPPEAVGQVTKEQRTQAGARDVDRRCHADLCGVEFDTAALLGEAGRHVADHRDLETVEDPHPAETDDDAPVKPRPGQSVQPGRHMRGDGSGLRAFAHASPFWVDRGLPDQPPGNPTPPSIKSG